VPTPPYGQISLSGTAQALSAAPVNAAAFTIKAPASNASNAFIGDASVLTTTGHIMCPGDELTYERRDESGLPKFQLHVSDFYVVGSSGDKVSWLASP
jgi:hypothetical protein